MKAALRPQPVRGIRFWIGRFCWMTGIVFAILVLAGLLRGRAVEMTLVESVLWALVSSSVFTGWRYYQARKGVACALCRDTVEE
ncbi:MAG: hypothetical protein JWQ01_772 [Massilia sp.]|nr:hypothetical protein [Massilia sp.]